MLCRAFDAAKVDGVSRKIVARRLGITSRQIDLWCAKSRQQAITSEMFVRLLSQEDALPPGARQQLMNDLATLAGFAVCEDVGTDRKAPTLQITEMCAALGAVADEVKISGSPASEAGNRTSPAETRKIVAALDRLIHEATQLKVAVGRGKR